MKRVYLFLCVFAMLFFVFADAKAQVSSATLYGTVTDATGSVIPGATVTVTQTETNMSWTLKTRADGSYRADLLPVGTYKVRVIAAGFKPLDREGLQLNAMQQAQLDLTVALGAASETVTVTTDLPLLNTSNATLGRTVDNREVDNLPLVNRDVYQLLSLTQGVQSATSVNNLGYPEEHTIINGSTDGTVGQVTYYLDGGLNMSGLRNTGNILPNPDALQEFVVQTNNFSAQYGRNSSGIVTVLSKLGTSQLHGSIFEFNRNTDFNAAEHATVGHPPFHSNIFGATIGGPIKHDRAFFFGSYGGQRWSTPGQMNGAILPTADQASGNFFANLPTSSGTIGTNCNMTLSAADKAAGHFIVCNPVTRQPFAGNIITSGYLDTTVQNLFNASMIPTLPSGAATYSTTVRAEKQTDEFLAKGSSQLGAKHHLAASYFQTNGNSMQSPGGNVPWSTQQFTWRQQDANVNDDWNINSRWLNQVWATYMRILGGRTNLPAVSLAKYGSSLNPQGPPALPQITVTGYFTLAQSIAGPVAGANVYYARDLVSTTFGRHALYFGLEGSLEKDAQNTLLNNYGVFSFSSSASARTGNALSDFITGRPNTFNQDAPVYANANYWTFGGFVQDDYRATSRLTINAGLRFDVQTPPTDTLNRYSTFQQGVQSTAVPSAIQGQLFYGDKGVLNTIVPVRINHLSPRVGVSWSPYADGRTVLHGAGGLFFGSIGGNEFELMSNAQPFDVRAQYNNVVSMTNIYSTDTTDFAGGVSPYPYVYNPANPRYIKPASLIVFPNGYRWPYSYQWNAGIQQQITATLAFGINYVGSFSRKLPLEIDHNYPVYNTASPTSNTTSTANSRRPILPGQISTLFYVESGQSSDYNGLQVSVEKRLSRHLSFKGYYTWSKTLASAAMDNNSLANAFEDYNNRYLDRQRSDFDIRHSTVTSVVWKPDYFVGYGRVVNSLLDGWTLTAIITLQSGAPFSITAGSDLNGDGNNNDRPNLSAGKYARVIGRQSEWFDTSAYCVFSPSSPSSCPGAGPAGSSGTVRPNSLSGPGVHNVDASFFRDFKIYDRIRFQLRTEVKNVLNLTNLGTPNGTFNSPNFGKVLSAASTGTWPNRQIQLGGRILF